MLIPDLAWQTVYNLYSERETVPSDNTRSRARAFECLREAAEFVDLVCDCKPDLIAITETWLTDNESASRALFTPEGYKLLDHPRLGRLGGGTGILFRNSIVTTKVAAAELQSFEYSEWSIRARTQRLN